jgi:hypothetical protein
MAEVMVRAHPEHGAPDVPADVSRQSVGTGFRMDEDDMSPVSATMIAAVKRRV